MTPPLLTSSGGSLLISRSMRSRMDWQTLSCSPMRFRLALSASRQACLMGSTACRATFSATTSRGLTRPTATFDRMRSRSPMRCSCSSTRSRKSGWRKKYSTTSRRSLMGRTSFSGNTSQRFIRRAPMGQMVLSMTLSNELPPSFIEPISSRLRTVNLSSRTYLSSSMRASDVMWPICVCCVMMRYCRMAPEAMMPFFRCSTPKPFRFFTSKCFSSFSRAVVSVNTQSSSSKVKNLLPKLPSNIGRLPRSKSTSLGPKLLSSLSM